jgi:hypothetical protein
MELDRRGCVVQPRPWVNRQREEPVDEAKPFNIPKRVVWKAFRRVKANRGAAGVDKQSIAGFDPRSHPPFSVVDDFKSDLGGHGTIAKANSRNQ